tara:strand:- start:3090 stop:3749 length:660 start_codon:yes stop_codon:yes gene_type:complete
MNWRTHIDQWASALAPFLAKPAHIDIRGPITEDELKNFEDDITYRIPDQLKTFLLDESSYINFWWDLKSDIIPLDVQNKPYGGYIEFNLESIHTLNADRTICLYGDELEHTKRQWEHAFPFIGVPNGDSIALDVLADPDNPPVIYLNHEEPDKQVRLAESFEEFIESWFALGCVGNEGWHLRHFVTDTKEIPEFDYGSATSNLDLSCKNAVVFREFFGL